MKADLDYVASKLDYKTGEVIDLYTVRVRRTKEEIREDALEYSLEKAFEDYMTALESGTSI